MKYIRENDTDFHRFDFSRFQEWLRSEIQHRQKDPVFLQRCKIRDLKKMYFSDFCKLEGECRETRGEYESSGKKEVLERLQQEIENGRKAIEGLSASVRQRSEEKRKATLEKLAGFQEKMDRMLREHRTLLEETPEKQRVDRALSAFFAWKEKIGLTQAEKELEEMLHAMGKRSSEKGSGFEQAAHGIVQRYVAPLVKKKKKSGEGIIEILSQVKLGCARAEMDYVVVWSSSSGEPVEVLAVVEVKRNPNDLAHGFLLRQENLAWFTGERQGYDPSLYKTARFRRGHFDQAAWHEERGKKHLFDASSFGRFKRESDHFLEGLFWVTSSRRLQGISSDEQSKIAYKISTDVSFSFEEGYLAGLMDWCRSLIGEWQSQIGRAHV